MTHIIQIQELDQLLSNVITTDLDKRRYIYGTYTESWKMCHLFMEYVNQHFIRNQVHGQVSNVNLQDLQQQIQQLQKVLFFDIKEFIDAFNKIFKYKGYKHIGRQFSKSFKNNPDNLASSLVIDLGNNVDQATQNAYNDLMAFKGQNRFFVDCFPNEIDNIMIRILTKNQIDNEVQRQLSWLDFNNEAIHLLSIEQLKFHCKHRSFINEKLVANALNSVD